MASSDTNFRPALSGLYVITDPTSLKNERQLIEGVIQALQGGARLIQYRNKQGSHTQCFQEAALLKPICDQYQRPLIINDHLEIAHQLDCGVHLGHEDDSIAEARALLGSKAIIGATCKNSLSAAKSAIESGANYLAFGALFASKSKPTAPLADLSILSEAKALWPNTSIVGIGGINQENCRKVISSGADMIAVINAIWNEQNHKIACTKLQQQFSINSTDLVEP